MPPYPPSKHFSPAEISPQIPRFMEIAEQAARIGGNSLSRWLGKVDVCEKNPGDFVTQADLDSQAAIFKFLQESAPGHRLQGEETLASDDFDPAPHSNSDSAAAPFRWIVDPLDGTTNFIHGLQSFSVSIALTWNDRLIAACVHDPVLDETFLAGLGAGATRNGQPIRVSCCDSIDHALLVVSFPSRIDRDSLDLQRFIRVICDSGASIRRLGSAALNLCYVADGRLDGYWATSLKPWDVAAGALILHEAGGKIQHINGSEFDLRDPQILATCHDQLLQELHPLLQVE